jgi:hypothetical protein
VEFPSLHCQIAASLIPEAHQGVDHLREIGEVWTARLVNGGLGKKTNVGVD